ARQAQEAMLAQLRALSAQSATRGNSFLDTYERDFAPVAREAVDAARQVGRPDLAGISADNASAFQQQRGAIQRQMQRAGVNPLDGMYGSIMGDLANAEGQSLVLNRNQARRGAAMDRYNALSGAAELGQMPLNAGINLIGSAGNMLSGGAQQYGQVAQGYSDSAAATSAAINNIAGMAAGYASGGSGGANAGVKGQGQMVQSTGKSTAPVAGVGTANVQPIYPSGVPWGDFVARNGARPSYYGSGAGAGAGWWQTGGR
ncbi:MAG: hypothetical protein KAX77_07125, partial [Xanthomonadales bacterium]|nr:hypothetical protein [Xanthomonadales bacterium]